MLLSNSIAIVDDDPSVRRAVGRLLASAGYEVRTFASGAELLVWPQAPLASCFLLDIYLDGMTGFELCERLRGAGVRAPIVFMTAHDNEQTRERARLLATVPLLRKPFDAHALLDAVHSAIASSHPAEPASSGHSRHL